MIICTCEESLKVHGRNGCMTHPAAPRWKASWRAAAAQFFSGTDVEKNLETCVSAGVMDHRVSEYVECSP